MTITYIPFSLSVNLKITSSSGLQNVTQRNEDKNSWEEKNISAKAGKGKGNEEGEDECPNLLIQFKVYMHMIKIIFE